MSNTLLDKIANKVSPIRRRFVQKQGELSAQIWDVLDRHNWTQQDLADKMGKKPSYISRILRGGGNPTLMTICAIEEALGEEVLVAPDYCDYSVFPEKIWAHFESHKSDLTSNAEAEPSYLQLLPSTKAQEVELPKNEFARIESVPLGSANSSIGAETRPYRSTGS